LLPFFLRLPCLNFFLGLPCFPFFQVLPSLISYAVPCLVQPIWSGHLSIPSKLSLVIYSQ
jgi:hypothetical protein